jgi:hypothetical protein
MRAMQVAWRLNTVVLAVVLIGFLGSFWGFVPLAGLLGFLALPSPFLVPRGWSACALLGSCVPGTLGESAHIGVVVVAVLASAVSFVVAATLRAGRETATGRSPAVEILVTWWPWCSALWLGLCAAGVLGTVLELGGAWVAMGAGDPKAEQGAPVWVPWAIAVLSVAGAWLGVRRAWANPSRERMTRQASAGLVAAILVWAVAMAVHTSLPEPVQGRYYGISGFVVGRSQNYEYGTLLGMVAPAVAGLWSLWLAGVVGGLRFSRP